MSEETPILFFLIFAVAFVAVALDIGWAVHDISLAKISAGERIILQGAPHD